MKLEILDIEMNKTLQSIHHSNQNLYSFLKVKLMAVIAIIVSTAPAPFCFAGAINLKNMVLMNNWEID
jgi:hypothetical protein